MTKLTQKKVAFEWGDKQEAAFQTLKNKLCSAPILALPQGAENFHLLIFGFSPTNLNSQTEAQNREFSRTKDVGRVKAKQPCAIGFVVQPEQTHWRSYNLRTNEGNLAPWRSGKRCTLKEESQGMEYHVPRSFHDRDPRLLQFLEGHFTVPLEGLHIDDKLQFVEEPVEIMKREIKRLKRSRIPLIKVCWNSRRGPEFTWEREDSFKKKYPHLFTNRASSSTTTS
ncbi:hypothetical protein Tco_1265419 [Tanacetum coccineum]